jgi:hypothetical protein
MLCIVIIYIAGGSLWTSPYAILGLHFVVVFSHAELTRRFLGDPGSTIRKVVVPIAMRVRLNS